MLQRFKGISEILAAKEIMGTINVSEEFKHLYFDIAGDPEPVAFDMLRMVVDYSHIVYGSDFPYSPAKVVINKKKHLENNEKYKELIDKIFKDNAHQLLD